MVTMGENVQRDNGKRVVVGEANKADKEGKNKRCS
jgi:hypothetical protein